MANPKEVGRKQAHKLVESKGKETNEVVDILCGDYIEGLEGEDWRIAVNQCKVTYLRTIADNIEKGWY